MSYPASDLNDRTPAQDFGITREDQTTDWFIEDQQASIVIRHGDDGEWTAALEDYANV